MFDTTTHQAHIELEVDHLKSIGFNMKTHEYSDGKIKRTLYLNDVIGAVPFSFTYYPPNPGYPNPMFLITMSLARVLHGTNAIMLRSEDDIRNAVDKANNLLSEYLPWLPSVDISSLVLQRIDLCFNHQVECWVQEYIRVLQLLTMAYRKTFPFVERDFPEKTRLQGVEYRTENGSNKSSFYDKELECGLQLAKGILRQEMKIYSPRTIAQKLGTVDPPSLQHVTPDIVIQLLESELTKLGLKDKQPTGLNASFRTLLDTYNFNTAVRLIGYMAIRPTTSREQMIAEGAKLRTLQDYERLISAASVTLAMADENVTLPPLSVVF